VIINKIYRIFFLITFCLVLVGTTTGCSFAKGRFIELNFNQEDHNQPEKLNEEEIFFAGGGYDKKNKKYYSAKIYNIKDKTLTDTGAVMNVPRSNYGLIKYDDNHILVLGGYCSRNQGLSIEECSQVAEIYNIKDNKFTRINDSNLKYKMLIRTALLDNGNVFVLSGNSFELFNPENNKFEIITNPKKYLDRFKNIRIKYTLNYYVFPKILVLNSKEILIHGYTSTTHGGGYVMEVFNLETQKSLPINTEDVYFYTNGTPIKINKDTVLIIGAGPDRNQVIKFDINNHQLEYVNKLPKGLAGNAILLDNSNILFTNGCVKNPDYVKSTSLIHAVYDYKKNKIYNYKTIRGSVASNKLIKFYKSVFIEETSDNKPMLYKY
jgi:lipoprotein